MGDAPMGGVNDKSMGKIHSQERVGSISDGSIMRVDCN